jgi:hypothetical protein
MVSFPQVSPPEPCVPSSLPMRPTCPAHLLLLYFTTRTIFGKEYRSLSSSLCKFLHAPVTSSFLGPNTHLNTLFSNPHSLRSSLNVSDQFSHPYRTTGNIIVLYILIFNFLGSQLSSVTVAAVTLDNKVIAGFTNSRL